LIRRGELKASRERHGSRDWWIVEPASVEGFLGKYGAFDGRRRMGVARSERIGTQARPAEADVKHERDALRARVVALEDALARQRSVTDLLRQADLERAAVVEHLLAAARAAERADRLRQDALTELDEAVAGFTRPGNLSALG
jgi:hypothetical protein